MNERSIFAAALDIADPTGRAAYLDEACAQQPELRRHIDELLAAQEKLGSFLAQPPAVLHGTEAYQPIAEGPGTRIDPYKLLQQIGEGVRLGQLRQGFVERQEIVRGYRGDQLRFGQLLALQVAAALETGLTTGVLDQDAPHGFRGGGKEVGAALPRLVGLTSDQPEIGFMHEGSGVERLSRRLSG